MCFKSFSRLSLSVLVTLILMYTQAAQAFESLGFTDLKKRVEILEKEDAYSLSRDELVKVIEDLGADIDEYIQENPENPDALVLSVRLGYMNEQFIKLRIEEGSGVLIDPESRFAELHQRLDKAIAMHPNYAAPYYWKAALNGIVVPVDDGRGNVARRPVNLKKAIEYAHKAVEFDGENGWYRRTLAMYYFTDGNLKAALEILDTPQMANSPVRLLIRDLEAFPLPFGTFFTQEDTDTYIEMLLGQKTIKDYPNLRVRAYVVPLSVEEMSEYFRSKWPEFEFFPRGRSDLFAQYMLPLGEGFRPSKDMSEARMWAMQNMGGIVLSVQEIKDADEEQRKKTPAGRSLPENLGDTFSYVFMINKRVVQ